MRIFSSLLFCAVVGAKGCWGMELGEPPLYDTSGKPEKEKEEISSEEEAEGKTGRISREELLELVGQSYRRKLGKMLVAYPSVHS